MVVVGRADHCISVPYSAADSPPTFALFLYMLRAVIAAVAFETALLSVALAGLEFAILMPRLPNAGTVRACLQAQQGCLIFFFCTWGLQIPLDLRYVVSLINPPQLKKKPSQNAFNRLRFNTP